jgi:hypothetical protein
VRDCGERISCFFMVDQSGDKASPCCTFLLPNRFHQDAIKHEASSWSARFKVADTREEFHQSCIRSYCWMPAVSERHMQPVTLLNS